MNQIQQKVWDALRAGGGDLRVYYQPVKRPSELGQPAKMFEALIRMSRSDGSVIEAAQFVPDVLEIDTLAIALDAWVLRQVVDDLRMLRACGYLHIRITVNLTAASLHDKDLPDRVGDVLSGLIEPCLILEVLESQPLDYRVIGDSVMRMALLSPILLDDIGIGYSNLDSIVNLEIDGLKINGGFVIRVLDSSKHRAVIRGLFSICHDLRLLCIAEWVESDSLISELNEMVRPYPQCDLLLQGFAVGMPAPLSEHIGHCQVDPNG
jgi:EAL domain-containing protein (putative c-di-GMP-specific phosphodiesterase class I)